MLNGLVNVADFLVNIIFSLYVFMLLFRFFLQWVKADFHNPVCQLVMRATNIVIFPLRKIVPGFFGLDWSCVAAAYFVFMLQNLLLGLLQGIEFSLIFVFAKPFLDIIFAAINMYIYLIIIRAIASWFIQGAYNSIFVAIYQVTEPLLAVARKLVKPRSGFDFSSIVVLVGLFCVQIFLQNVII